MEVNDIRLLESNFLFNYDKEEEEDKIKVGLSIKASFDESESLATVILNAKTIDHNLQFYFDVKYGGKFSIPEEERGNLDKFCKINCPAILFPFLREYVADQTRRAGLEPFHFGPINFVEASKNAHWDQGEDNNSDKEPPE